MKKRICLIAITLILALTATMGFVACNNGPESDVIIDSINAGLAKASDATTITQTIVISAGEERLTLDETVYEVNGESINATRTLTTLNDDITAGEKYIVTTESIEIDKNSLPTAITLTPSYFYEGKYTYLREADGTQTLTFTVGDNAAALFLQLSADEARGITGISGNVTLTADAVSLYEISYTSANGNSVKISYTYTYPTTQSEA